MAPFLNNRLRCFYCGVRSSRSAKGPVREWKCSQCQAVNYLDEKGEITDPPVAVADSQNSKPQYALPLSQTDAATSSVSSSAQDSLFCSICIKNQNFYTQALASYLPPTSDPDYDDYEASLPTYRRSLEERYPQVCANCEPRVRERIRQAGYVAKADHLRRMMDESKRGRRRRHGRRLSWRSLLVLAGAVAYWVSIGGQIAWSAMGAMSRDHLSFGVEQETSSVRSLVRPCVSYARIRGQVPNECAAVLQPYAGYALALGALAIWWNPKLRHKVNGQSGRLKGLREYYQVQIIFLVARLGVWAGLQDDLIMDYNPKFGPAVHASLVIFTVIVAITSRRVIKFDTTPLVAWQDNVEPLVADPKPKTDPHLFSPPNSQTTNSSASYNLQRFPVDSLADPPRRSPQPHRPLTPPDETVGDEDAMDWMPSQPSFQPNMDSIRSSSQPTPSAAVFQNQPPPSHDPYSRQLHSRNPEVAARSTGSKVNPFQNAPALQPTRGSSDESQESAKREEVVMAPPKFFPPGDLRADTGLESLFDRTFSLADEPDEIRKTKTFAKSMDDFKDTTTSHRTSHLLKSVLLAFTLMMLASTGYVSIPRNTTETAVLASCFLISGFSVLESLMRPMVFWSLTDFPLPVFELVASVYLTVLHSRGGDHHQIIFDRVGQGLVAFMLVQEVMALLSATPHNSTPQTSFPVEQRKPSPENGPGAEPAFEPERKGNPSKSRQRSPYRREDNLSFQYSAPVGNNDLFGSHNPSHQQNGVSARIPTQSSTSFSQPSSPPRHPQRTPGSFHGYLNGSIDAMSQNSQATAYPPPFSSFSRPPVDPSESFSSLGSALPENVLSAASTVSTDYASSETSEPPSPQPRARQQTPGRQKFRSPSITGLSLEDSPVRPGPSRYSLRNRMN